MDWPMYRYVERRASRTNAMLKRLGVDTVKLTRLENGEAFSDARTKCLKCINARECLDWFGTAPPGSSDPSFCPNYSLFISCKKP